MKILLLGEYSSLHWTLAEGLRLLGHDVTVASDGDGFKSYKRDIDLVRRSSSLKHTGQTFWAVFKNLHNFKNYDVVQLINPCFTQLSVGVNRKLYSFLKKHNRKVFMGGFGDDTYWLRACLSNKVFKYSEFFVDNKRTNIQDTQRLTQLWGESDRKKLNEEIAETCDGIVACLYEYYEAYKSCSGYIDKLTYIPLPINVDNILYLPQGIPNKVKFFIGINKARSEFKGTDIMYRALNEICSKYKDSTEMYRAESLPYSAYISRMAESNVVLDQLYSYTPAMNGLLAMAMGKVLVGGGESEMYRLLNEDVLKPIVNVTPSVDDVYNKLEQLILNKQELDKIGEQSRLFVQTYHDYRRVAQQYIDFWTK